MVNATYSAPFKVIGILLRDDLTKGNVVKTGRLLVAMPLIALSVACAVHETIGVEEPALWKIQKLIASKKYVDRTHEFAPGIPHWPGFPDERRKTIYWYDKQPETWRVA